MRFPNAYKGVKKLFITEIISVIVAFLMMVASVLLALGKNNDALLAAGGAIALAGGIALIVVFIIQIVALYQGGKDEIRIKYAFFLTIFAIVLSLISSIFTSIKSVPVLVDIGGYINTLIKVVELVALEYTLIGIAVLMDKLGNSSLANRGRSLATAVLILFIVSILMNLYANIMDSNAYEWVKITLTIAAIVAGIAELVVYVLTLVYYGRATKELKQ